MPKEIISSVDALKILKNGSEDWNKWQSENLETLVDFEDFKFPHNSYFKDVNFSKLNFTKAIFEGLVWFENCTFLERVDLTRVILRGAKLRFVDCVFEGDLNVFGCCIEKCVDSESIQNEGSDFSFRETTFKRGVNIRDSEFVDFGLEIVTIERDLKIIDTICSGFFRLVGSDVLGKVEVWGVNTPQKFEGFLKVRGNQFKSDVSFKNVSMEGPVIFLSTIDGNLSLTDCRFLSEIYSPYFVKSEISGNLDLAHTQFSRVPDFRFVSIGKEVIFSDTDISFSRLDSGCLTNDIESKNYDSGRYIEKNIAKELDARYDYSRFSKLTMLARNNSNRDYEKTFFIDELRSKRTDEHKDILLMSNCFYDYFGGSGYHSHKPFLTILFAWLIFASIFHIAAYFCGQLDGFTWQSCYSSLLFSAANLVPFLASAGDAFQDSKSVLFLADDVNSFPRFLYALTLLENFFGVILWFLLGLTLRNRFRI